MIAAHAAPPRCVCGRPARVDKNGYPHASCNACRKKRQAKARAARTGRRRLYTPGYFNLKAEWIIDKVCELCGAIDQLTVNHLIPLRDDPSRKNLMDTTNWQVLCAPCHGELNRLESLLQLAGERS